MNICFCRCVIVLYNLKKGRQQHIFSSSKKTITAVAFSPDGRNIVTGEVKTFMIQLLLKRQVRCH